MVGISVDSRITTEVNPKVQADALALPFINNAFQLCYSDPPYSDIDAERYQSKMPDRRKVLYEAYRVIEPGGFLVWMDTVLPMYRKDMWHWCGAISLWRSTNHRIRGVSIFERLP
jgi:ubiquinone/menaquinone biosynthesis C-methylase UbiE